MDKKFRLDDDQLNNVAGGMEAVPDDPQSGGRCPECSTLLIKQGSSYVCPDCGYTRGMGGTQPVTGSAGPSSKGKPGHSLFSYVCRRRFSSLRNEGLRLKRN